jgi:hypothetical protein
MLCREGPSDEVRSLPQGRDVGGGLADGETQAHDRVGDVRGGQVEVEAVEVVRFHRWGVS